jgi:hypothetical protein
MGIFKLEPPATLVHLAVDFSSKEGIIFRRFLVEGCPPEPLRRTLANNSLPLVIETGPSVETNSSCFCPTLSRTLETASDDLNLQPTRTHYGGDACGFDFQSPNNSRRYFFLSATLRGLLHSR